MELKKGVSTLEVLARHYFPNMPFPENEIEQYKLLAEIEYIEERIAYNLAYAIAIALGAKK